RDNGRGHDFSGLYLEGYDPTPAAFDNTTVPSNALSVVHGPASYGYGYNHLLNEQIVRASADNQAWGQNFNTGDYEELELCHQATRQAPSFKHGLPGMSHFPSGGTVAVTNDS